MNVSFQPRHKLLAVELKPNDYTTPVSGVIVPAEAQVLDVTGRVLAVGSEVENYNTGDLVLFSNGTGQVYEEYGERCLLIEERYILGSYTLERSEEELYDRV